MAMSLSPQKNESLNFVEGVFKEYIKLGKEIPESMLGKFVDSMRDVDNNDKKRLCKENGVSTRTFENVAKKAMENPAAFQPISDEKPQADQADLANRQSRTFTGTPDASGPAENRPTDQVVNNPAQRGGPQSPLPQAAATAIPTPQPEVVGQDPATVANFNKNATMAKQAALMKGVNLEIDKREVQADRKYFQNEERIDRDIDAGEVLTNQRIDKGEVETEKNLDAKADAAIAAASKDATNDKQLAQKQATMQSSESKNEPEAHSESHLSPFSTNPLQTTPKPD